MPGHPITPCCKHIVPGGVSTGRTHLDFRVMVQVLLADFLLGFPTGDATRTMTYSGCSRAALLPSRQY